MRIFIFERGVQRIKKSKQNKNENINMIWSISDKFNIGH